MKKFFKDFAKFINRGNVIDLAIGIIIGASFQAIVKSLANDIIMPLISSLCGFNIKSGSLVLAKEVVENGEVVKDAIILQYGTFLQSVLDFFIIAFSIFVTIRVISGLKNRYTKQKIKYLKKLKKEHPELFDEDDEPGAVLYESLKAKYPEYFKGEIEEKKPEITDHELLIAISEGIAKMNEKFENNEENL